MSEIDANIIVDGQKTVATIPQEGEIVQDGGEVDATCIVEDSNGKRHKAVKIINIDDEPTDKSEIDAQILNNNNELITVTEEQEGEVILQDNSEIDFHCLVQKDDGKQLSVKTVELDGEIIKTGGAIDTNCLVQGSNGKNQLAVKVFKRGGGEIIETVYGTNSITFNAKANGLKALTLFGGTEQSGTPTPTTPQNIISNNGAIKYSNNLLDMATENIVLGKYINNSGAVLDSGPNFYNSKYIPVVASGTYTWSTSSSVNYFSVMEYDSNYVFKKRTLFNNAGTSGSITLRSDTAFVLIGSNMDSTDVTLDKIATVDWQFEKGSSATAYKPYSPTGIYTDGTIETVQDSLSNTATAEMLLKVGNYQDTQEVLSGHISRKIGIKVLDGTENWREATLKGLFFCDMGLPSITGYGTKVFCTHYRSVNAGNPSMPDLTVKLANTTTFGVAMHIKDLQYQNDKASFVAYLVAQYNAGTPVIVIYPLATSTTETVTGQVLTTKEGTNTISITQASISNLDLEAKYKKGN